MHYLFEKVKIFFVAVLQQVNCNDCISVEGVWYFVKCVCNTNRWNFWLYYNFRHFCSMSSITTAFAIDDIGTNLKIRSQNVNSSYTRSQDLKKCMIYLKMLRFFVVVLLQVNCNDYISAEGVWYFVKNSFNF